MIRAFCSICLGDGGNRPLVRADDGAVECDRCRNSHPRDGGYSFEGGRPEVIGGVSTGTRKSRFSGGKQRL